MCSSDIYVAPAALPPDALRNDWGSVGGLLYVSLVEIIFIKKINEENVFMRNIENNWISE